jgi:hypothetical protein
MRMLRLPSPATVIALVALFFALGGSAFALGQATAAKYQLRCQAGAVRGIAVVRGDSPQFPSNFSGSASLFARRFNCSGGAITVRRAETGVFDVRFGGNSANAGIASSATSGAVSVTRNPDGSFRVVVYDPQADNNRDIQVDRPFQLVII